MRSRCHLLCGHAGAASTVKHLEHADRRRLVTHDAVGEITASAARLARDETGTSVEFRFGCLALTFAVGTRLHVSLRTRFGEHQLALFIAPARPQNRQVTAASASLIIASGSSGSSWSVPHVQRSVTRSTFSGSVTGRRCCGLVLRITCHRRLQAIAGSLRARRARRKPPDPRTPIRSSGCAREQRRCTSLARSRRSACSPR